MRSAARGAGRTKQRRTISARWRRTSAPRSAAAPPHARRARRGRIPLEQAHTLADLETLDATSVQACCSRRLPGGAPARLATRCCRYRGPVPRPQRGALGRPPRLDAHLRAPHTFIGLADTDAGRLLPRRLIATSRLEFETPFSVKFAVSQNVSRQRRPRDLEGVHHGCYRRAKAQVVQDFNVPPPIPAPPKCRLPC